MRRDADGQIIYRDEPMLFEFYGKFEEQTINWFIRTKQYEKDHTNLDSMLRQRINWRATDELRKQLGQRVVLTALAQVGQDLGDLILGRGLHRFSHRKSGFSCRSPVRNPAGPVRVNSQSSTQ